MSTTALPDFAVPDHIVSVSCRELIQAVLDASDEADATARMHRAAARLVHSGVPIAAVRAELRKGMRTSVRQRASRNVPEQRRSCPATNIDAALDAFAIATEVVSQVYAQSSLPGPQEAAVDALAVALLSDSDAVAARARECGMTVADSYSVIAVAVPARGRSGRTPLAAMARRVRAALSAHCGAAVLVRLSDIGGTVLIPGSRTDALDVRALLSAAVRCQLVAAMVTAIRSEVPAAAGQAHELLGLALALGRTSGLYRFDDLALEYQLTRPGPARDRLAAVLDPLESQPHLRDTLELFLTSSVSRRALARQLNLHANTVEYRLKRVAALTGHDPLTPAGQWYLRSAMIARVQPNPRGN